MAKCHFNGQATVESPVKPVVTLHMEPGGNAVSEKRQTGPAICRMPVQQLQGDHACQACHAVTQQVRLARRTQLGRQAGVVGS